MKTLQAFMLAAFAMLPTFGQAQTVNICDRTPQVRDAIMQLKALGADDCAAVDSEAFAAIQQVFIQRENVRTLKAGDFRGLASLLSIYLHDNQLSTLPAGVFDGLTSLLDLWLSENRLTTLPAGVFDSLTRLQNLYLSNNQLTTLPAGVFDRLTSLEELNLYDNQLTSLPAGVFDRLTSLEELHLFNNQLAALPAGVFDRLTNLQRLLLGGNNLTALPAGVFDKLTSLRVLSLNGNRLTALPAGVFDRLTSLETLELNNIQLTALPAGVFDNLAYLRELYLDGNQLTRAGLPAGVFDRLTLHMQQLWLRGNHLVGLTRSDPLFANLSGGVNIRLDGQTEAPGQAQTVNICDRTPQVRDAILQAIEADDCAAVDSQSLASLTSLYLRGQGITALPAGLFDGLTSLQRLDLGFNRLTTLPAGVFDKLISLQTLNLGGNQFTALPAGVFDKLTSLQDLDFEENQLTTLPAGVFDKLTSLQDLVLDEGQLTTLPAGLFDRLTRLEFLSLADNKLTTLPAGLFDKLTSLQRLDLYGNLFTALPAGLFDRLTSLQELSLEDNRLTTLPAGVFDNLANLRDLYLHGNGLTALPSGVFNSLTRLQALWLNDNHLVGLTRSNPLFANLPDGVSVQLDGQTEAPETPTTTATRLAAAVPLLVSASDSMRQGFVRIINESEESGSVRILAFDDAGNAANPIEIRLNANHEFHFNAGDLENGNANKGINAGVGSPSRGDWRLDVETALGVRVLSFIRTNDGFLTAMHDVLQRDAQGRLAALTFNPARNTSRVSKLRLVNIGANAESVRIDGVDGQGNNAGPVSLTLAAGEARTLSAQDLENGAQGLTGMLDAGNGKWRLFITAEQSVVGMSLLDSASGHLSNISTMGNAIEGQ